MIDITMLAADNGQARVTRVTTIGPIAEPVSERSRHAAKNCGRPILGEASDPSVMTMPELAPLPIPMARATMPIVVAVWASGKVRSARAWMKIYGTATHQRPNLSMRAPPGRKSRTSAAIDQA